MAGGGTSSDPLRRRTQRPQLGCPSPVRRDRKAITSALECCRAPGIVDRGPEPLELVGRRMVQPGRNEQTVEREHEVGAAGRCVVDGDSEVLLQRRAGVEPDVVVRPKETGLAEALERGGQLACWPQQILVVAPTVGLEPVAIPTCVARYLCNAPQPTLGQLVCGAVRGDSRAGVTQIVTHAATPAISARTPPRLGSRHLPNRLRRLSHHPQPHSHHLQSTSPHRTRLSAATTLDSHTSVVRRPVRVFILPPIEASASSEMKAVEVASALVPFGSADAWRTNTNPHRSPAWQRRDRSGSHSCAHSAHRRFRRRTGLGSGHLSRPERPAGAPSGRRRSGPVCRTRPFPSFLEHRLVCCPVLDVAYRPDREVARRAAVCRGAARSSWARALVSVNCTATARRWRSVSDPIGLFSRTPTWARNAPQRASPQPC